MLSTESALCPHGTSSGMLLLSQVGPRIWSHCVTSNGDVGYSASISMKGYSGSLWGLSVLFVTVQCPETSKINVFFNSNTPREEAQLGFNSMFVLSECLAELAG